jgi:hypothetical protein
MEVPLIRNPCEKLIRADYMLTLFQQLTHRQRKVSRKRPDHKRFRLGGCGRAQAAKNARTLADLTPTELNLAN